MGMGTPTMLAFCWESTLSQIGTGDEVIPHSDPLDPGPTDSTQPSQCPSHSLNFNPIFCYLEILLPRYAGLLCTISLLLSRTLLPVKGADY